MYNSLFRVFMPYCVEIKGSDVTLFDRSYRVVFRCKATNPVSVAEIKSHFLNFTNNPKEGSFRFWLYRDSLNPENYPIKDKLDPDAFAKYCIRLGHLCEILGTVDLTE